MRRKRAKERATTFTPIPATPRGIDLVNGAYQFLELVPKDRNVDDLKFSMEWGRRHDQSLNT